jgi:hypothetical protein
MPETSISQALALQEALKAEMDDVVRAATQAAVLLEPPGNMQKSQLQNVLNVAEESESVAVVINFIRYQMGRGDTGKDWQHNGFGLHVVRDITDDEGPVRQTLENVLNRVSARLGEESVTDDLRRHAHVELMRYYLGYLARAFVFGSSGVKNSWSQLRQATEV